MSPLASGIVLMLFIVLSCVAMMTLAYFMWIRDLPRNRIERARRDRAKRDKK